MKRLILTAFLSIFSLAVFAQRDTLKIKKERLDFAKTYFELGGTFFPSFTGKRLVNDQITTFGNSASINQYLNWGAFHFWGHAEFYVTIPLGQINFSKNDQTNFQLSHSVATGARFYPWAYREKKIRPYVGLSWSALDFKQKIKPDENQPVHSKDFLLNYETGLMYGYRSLSLRLGVNYFKDNVWNYPLSRTVFEEIETPHWGVQLGLLYAFESSKSKDKAKNDEPNGYPRVSKQSLGTTKFGAFFAGVGPSISYSLTKSEYNKSRFPYLKNKLTSTNYFDISAGYHFYKIGLFAALSFRNPLFKTSGYGAEQSIRKTSLALEINKFLLDYTGFVPYIGLNIAYDNLKYKEKVDGLSKELTINNKFEPGITFGFDIQPRKNEEALILRTNLRWYPSSAFKVDGYNFELDQLEYNLIQVVLYPDRLRKKKV